MERKSSVRRREPSRLAMQLADAFSKHEVYEGRNAARTTAIAMPKLQK